MSGQLRCVLSCVDVCVCSEHEAECDYKPVQCPNNPDCPVILKKVRLGHFLTVYLSAFDFIVH